MEHLRRALDKSADIKQIWETDEYVDKYSDFVDELILNKNRIKCWWEKIIINKNLEIYKSTLNTITENSASLSIYIPSRHSSYTLYFSYNTWKFSWNHTDYDEWTWLRIDHLRLDFEKLEIFNKKTKKWEYLDIVHSVFKKELDWIVKVMYSEVFNNSEFNNNISEKDI